MEYSNITKFYQILMKSKKEMVHLLRVGEFDLTLLFSDW